MSWYVVAGSQIAAARARVECLLDRLDLKLGLTGYEAGYSEGSFLWFVYNIYFQYYSMFIFLVSLGMMFGVSYLTREPTPERIAGLTFATVTIEGREQSRSSWGARDVVASLLVMAAIISAYVYFSG